MKGLILILFFALVPLLVLPVPTQRVYLSGTDKDHTVTWDFMIDKGRQAGDWNKIEVPSNWEFQGFGTYHYGWPERESCETALYRTRFLAMPQWDKQNILLVFEGVMTDAEVKVNGVSVGEPHQGGFYRFSYDITSFVKFGTENQLEVVVHKLSANESVNRAELEGDYWIFGGIYRPVYLEIKPQTHIRQVAVDARADGSFQMEVFPVNTQPGDYVVAQITTLGGEKLGASFSDRIREKSRSKMVLKTKSKRPLLWTAETPHLYQVEVKLLRKGMEIHQIRQRFGFRTVEVRAFDGVYVNGQKILIKGVNRHSHWPATGRCLSREVHINDINLIREMNMNAVRMSHYPPDPEFLDLCDSLGLYVFDELAGWQKSYDTSVGQKLVREMVERDVNHPSVLIWDNGNEGGWNRELDGEFARYDLQKREVFHPWEKSEKWDSRHYPDFFYLANSLVYTREIILPTEFLHGLYDGGSGAGLEDYWTLYTTRPNFAGGFLWVFADEGVVRTDQEFRIDANKNCYPDGILGPHREKEASVFTIRQIWSPVQIELKIMTDHFDGRLKIENRYDFTNLKTCSFSWKLTGLFSPAGEWDAQVEKTGLCASPDLDPGAKGELTLPLPSDYRLFDVLYLTARDYKGREICTWSWPLKQPHEYRLPVQKNLVAGKISLNDSVNRLLVTVDQTTCDFDKTTGYLNSVTGRSGRYSLSNGPVLAGVDLDMIRFDVQPGDTLSRIITEYRKDNYWLRVCWQFECGKPVRIDYSYNQSGEADFMGITFDYPENQVLSLKWMGNGPYRVWKNRMKGNLFGVWKKDYNNSVTGESYIYPEFKGYHSELYRAELTTTEGRIVILSHTPGLFLQLFKPQPPEYAQNLNTSPAFPKGDLGFLHAISPIGTKFHPASDLGPQGMKNRQLNDRPLKGTLFFEFE